MKKWLRVLQAREQELENQKLYSVNEFQLRHFSGCHQGIGNMSCSHGKLYHADKTMCNIKAKLSAKCIFIDNKSSLNPDISHFTRKRN